MIDPDNPTAVQTKEFEDWLLTRPAWVQELARQLPPFAYYRIRATGQYCTIQSYFEDGCVSVATKGPEGSPIRAMLGDELYTVFGIRREKLEQVTDGAEIERARLFLERDN